MKEEAESLVKYLNDVMGEQLNIDCAKTGLDGLFKYRMFKPEPVIIIIDNHLPDMYGMSVASIIKDSNNGKDALVYLLTDEIADNINADFLISSKTNICLLAAQIKYDIDKKLLMKALSENMLRALDIQNGSLPLPIDNDNFRVNYLFSAYNKLSGDGLYYWYTAQSNKLYGYIFDCVGHGIESYGQVSSIWCGLKKSMKIYQMGVYKSLVEVMEEINTDLLDLYDYTNVVSALIFCFDFQEQTLKYCPAGIPFLITKKVNEPRQNKLLTSYLLGYDMNSEFIEEKVSLKDIEEVIFLSDGLSDLFLSNMEIDEKPEIAKHDDVSAVWVKLKKEG